MVKADAINELAKRGNAWLETAAAGDLWAVMQNGDLDARVGMPGTMSGLGALEGPGPFEAEILSRSWARRAKGDLEAWFVANARAQEAVRAELRANLTEVFFDLGEWTWKGEPPTRPAR